MMKCYLLLSTIVFIYLNGCKDNSNFSVELPENTVLTNKKRVTLGIREIKDTWTFYGRQFGEEIWMDKNGKYETKKVKYTDNFKQILWEVDSYYTGNIFVSTDPDGGNYHEFISLLYDYSKKIFYIDYNGPDNAIMKDVDSLISEQFSFDDSYGYRAASNNETLVLADMILSTFKIKRLE